MALDYVVDLWMNEQVMINLVYQDTTISGMLPYKLLNDMDIIDSYVNEITYELSMKCDRSIIKKFLSCLIYVEDKLETTAFFEPMAGNDFLPLCELATKTKCVDLIQYLVQAILDNDRSDKMVFLRDAEALKILLKTSAAWNVVLFEGKSIVESDLFEVFITEAQTSREWYNLRKFLLWACSSNYDLSKLNPVNCKLFIDYYSKKYGYPLNPGPQNE